METELTGIWLRVLQIKGLGRHEDFAAAGGDSLDAAEILLDVSDRFGVDLPPEILIGPAGTVAGMAQEIARHRRGGAADTGPALGTAR
ncbi:MAG: acyl carrier protein [Alphaproteobacteria bacterium]|nr:acyl carrier protein [Alphaproteobacteria bacterium]